MQFSCPRWLSSAHSSDRAMGVVDKTNSLLVLSSLQLLDGGGALGYCLPLVGEGRSPAEPLLTVVLWWWSEEGVVEGYCQLAAPGCSTMNEVWLGWWLPHPAPDLATMYIEGGWVWCVLPQFEHVSAPHWVLLGLEIVTDHRAVLLWVCWW